MNVRQDQIKQWKVKSEGFHNYSCSVQRYMPVAMFAVHNRFKPAICWQITDTWKWAGYILGTIYFWKHCKLWSWRTGSLEIVTERWSRPIKHSKTLRKEVRLAVWAIQVLCWRHVLLNHMWPDTEWKPHVLELLFFLSFGDYGPVCLTLRWLHINFSSTQCGFNNNNVSLFVSQNAINAFSLSSLCSKLWKTEPKINCCLLFASISPSKTKQTNKK